MSRCTHRVCVGTLTLIPHPPLCVNGAGPLYDIRSPLGVSPAALRALKAAPPHAITGLRPTKEQGFTAYQSFRKTRANLLKTQTKKRLKAVAVDFRRVWWDKDLAHNSNQGGSIWRPVPPTGYVSLGGSLLRDMQPSHHAIPLPRSASVAANVTWACFVCQALCTPRA